MRKLELFSVELFSADSVGLELFLIQKIKP